ncbi:isochorismatase family protein [Nocardia salmonicida]|uniref:isochorismatase family protein n=1 Tax=Nocardia salmonicida TaxID=53431 RepID=UPI00341B9627
MAANDPTPQIVPNINRLAETLRTAGGSIAWVLPGTGKPSRAAIEFFGPAIAESFSASGGSGPPRTRLWSELAADNEDVFVEKFAFSAFFPGRCTLPQQLEQRGIDTVLIMGDCHQRVL